MNIGVRLVVIAEALSDRPVPVGAKAITPAIPYSEAKPGKRCEQENKQIPFSRFWKNPTERIEKHQCGMEEKEKIIEYLIDHAQIIF